MNSSISDLKKELKKLRDKRTNATAVKNLKKSDASVVKNLKKQIKAEKFRQTRSGKIFNKIADVGDAGYRATSRYMTEKTIPKGKKKKTPARVSVEEMMRRLPQ